MSKNGKRPFQAMALYTAILSQLVGSILVGIFGGRWLDRVMGTVPLFMIIGLFLGLATGIYAMLRTVKHFNTGD
jgi:ATP synthase protein I